MGLETNVFAITNLQDLSSEYRLYRIKGLEPEQDEYYQNCELIKKKFSYKLQNPVTLVERDHVPYLVVRSDCKEPPPSYNLIRTQVTFEACLGEFLLDYSVRSAENDEICLRFLQFMIQEPLKANKNLWQPASGQPLFSKVPTWSGNNEERFEGYSVRAVLTPNGGLGFCVDVANKIVGANPLPAHMNRDQFSRLKTKHCIYHYGHNWYEVALVRLDGQNVTDYKIKRKAEWVSLFQFIMDESAKPIPPELAQLPHDSSVAIYRTNRDEERRVPIALCFPVLGTGQNDARNSHRRTILPAHVRSRGATDFVRRNLLSLKFGRTTLQVSPDPIAAPSRIFAVPDLTFARDIRMTVRGTHDARQVSLEELGAARLALLEEVGFYVQGVLDRQYLILPQSAADSFGQQFVKDLKRVVNQLYPQEVDYDPEIITYSDLAAHTFVDQGVALLRRLSEYRPKPGYAVVMVHHVEDRQDRSEDQLKAMVIRKLKKEYDITAAVIHSKVGQEGYELGRDKNGQPCYRPSNALRGKLEGYVRNVALNKVLLTNHRWPFVLGTPLHADIIVGIDVKAHTAGLVIVANNGSAIRSLLKTSKQKEKLGSDQIKAYLLEILRAEAAAQKQPVRHIVIHRDGKLYPSELKGAREALALLKAQGIIDPQAMLTIVEIPKNSFISFRLFESTARQGRGKWIENPQIGTCYIVDETDGYICTTGRAFPRNGTVKPLHVRRIEGALSLEECLEDIFYLSALAWTRPEDCTRYPITIKLNDRFLGDEATEYDEDAIDSALITSEEEEA